MATNIDAGVGQHATVTNQTGLAGSVTQNPLTPVQAGRTLLSLYYSRSPLVTPWSLNLSVVLSQQSPSVGGTVSVKEMVLRLVSLPLVAMVPVLP